MPDRRSTIFGAVTGLQADVSGRTEGDLRGMLLAVGGPSSRTRSGINLTRAAAALAVSRRTVERWMQTAQTGTGQRPSVENATSLARQARQAATTQAGRRAALAGTSTRQAITRGARLTITASQGPRASGQSYLRFRTTQLELDPASAEAMLDAWERGGDRGFMTWATGHWDQEYVPDWEFGSVSEVDLEHPSGGEWR